MLIIVDMSHVICKRACKLARSARWSC